MKAPQIFAILTPLLVGLATVLVKYLAPATVAEIGTVLGLVVTALVGVRNVFVPPPSPSATSKLPNAAGMMMGLVVLVMSLWTGCAAFTKAVPLLEPAGACIATQLLDGGAVDPLQIVAACAGTTIEDVIAVVETLMAQQPDSGATPTPTQMRLAAVHTRALGMRVAK